MIKRITENPRPVILGKVRIGQWVKGQAGEKFDHFKIAKNVITQDGSIEEDTETTNHIRSQLKLNKNQKLTRIPIYFSGNSIQDVYDNWYSLRWGQRSYCMSKDGLTALRANIKVNGGEPRNGQLKIQKGDDVEIVNWLKVDCADSEQGCPYYSINPDERTYCQIGCKLLFHIQGLTRRGGFFVFYSHSFHTTRQIYNGLRTFERMLSGHLSFAPFQLALEETRNQKNQKIYVVHLEMIGDLEKIRADALESAKIEMHFLKEMREIRDTSRKLIQMQPEDESPEHGEDHTQEFYGNQDVASEIPEDAKKVDINEDEDRYAQDERDAISQESNVSPDDDLPF